MIKKKDLWGGKFSVNKKIKEYQNFIKKNFDYVGNNFAYEARSIHYDKKETKEFLERHLRRFNRAKRRRDRIIYTWFDDKSN